MPSARSATSLGATAVSPRNLALQIATGRLAVASAIAFAPQAFLRTLGVDAATAARVVWLTRMMAVRDGAIGAGGTAAARRGAGVRAWLLAGAASDAVDAVVLANAIKQGRLHGIAATVAAPAAAGAAVFAVAVAARRPRD